MVRLISRQRVDLAALKLTKLFGIDDFPAAKDSGKVLIIIIYCYLIIGWYFGQPIPATKTVPILFVFLHSLISIMSFIYSLAMDSG